MKTTWTLEYNGQTRTVSTQDPENHTAHMAWQKGTREFAGAPPFNLVKVTRHKPLPADVETPEQIEAKVNESWRKLKPRGA
jgi:hypothetical protein